MAETLTESFCERCGTRYEFQAPTRLNPLRKTRGVIGGLRNYLTSQDALSDAMSDAMRSEEDNLASAQLDAFHESFNFCIDCRQYTCLNCWNDAAGRCRSCVPIPGTDDVAEDLAASAVAALAEADEEPALSQAEIDRRLGLDAWPTSDLPTGDAIATAGEAGHVVEPRAVADELPAVPATEPEPFVADVEPEWEPIVADIEPAWEPVAAVIEPEPAPEPVLADVQPEPVLAEAEAEWEPAAAVVEPEPEAEPVLAEAEPEWEPAAEVEREPAFAEIPSEPEPVAAEVQPEPIRPPLRVVAWDEDSAYEVLEPEPIVSEWEPVAAEVEPEPEPVAAVVEPEPEPEPVAAEAEPEPEPEPVAALAEPEPEPEPVAAVAEPEPEPEPVAAVAEPEPEPEPGAAEAEPEPARPARRLAPISETILDFPIRPTPDVAVEDDRAAAVADSPELAARRAQLDSLGLGDPGQGPITPEPSPMSYRSRGASVSQAELARQAVLRGSFWEASAREVAGGAGQVGVQSCGQCGLSLSANARFCRRCGTRQAQSA